MSAYVYKMTAFAVLAFGLFSQNANAQLSSLFGSGAMQGGMVCPYQQTASRAGSNISDEEREARSAVTRLEAQRTANRSKRDGVIKLRVDNGKRKIERYFDGDVADFLITHVDTLKRCDQYQSLANRCSTPPTGTPAPAATSGDSSVAAAPAVDCNSLEPVADKLIGKWTERRGNQGPYCVGSSARNAGGVAAAICADNELLPERTRGGRGRAVSNSECARALADYRKATIEYADSQGEDERLEDEIAERNANLREAAATAEINRRSRMNTEAGCETCDAYNRGYSYQRPQRDWGSTLSNVIGGLGLMYVGRQAERANAEESAQLGMPSNQSYGYPYYQAGISGVINGLAGPGAYGCASTTGGGGPISLGANGALNLAGGGGAFGPAGAQGGAFGYPQNMYSSPWGGGAFNPGLNINGGFNGPFGGTGGGQFGQFPGNGNMAMCFTFPCNVGGQGGAGGQFGLGGQLGGQFGQPGYDPSGQFGGGNQFGLNGQLSAQYQLQMLQQQQQAAQQYYAQQQQYYQQQYQAQMQYQQQVQQRQQQAVQLQQQITQLNMQLQQLYYSNNGGGGAGSIGGGFNLGGSFNLGTSYGSATIGAPLPGGYSAPTIGNPGYNPGYNPGTPYTNPGAGGTVRGR